MAEGGKGLTAHPWLVCGVSGPELPLWERRLLEALQPGGIILFSRNIAEVQQVQALVRELRRLPGRPFVAVDLEGGTVNRLRSLVGELPSPAQLAMRGEEAARSLGRACGAVCAALGIPVDLAPVLDVASEDGVLSQQQRCWGFHWESVSRLAGAFLEGLEGYGVQGCLKHYPGLGSGKVDSHKSLPVLEDQVREERLAFFALSSPTRAVMVAHALAPALGEGVSPCSLSRRIVGRLPKDLGPIMADDLEMGALADWGTLAERAAAALWAGCHLVLLCNALDDREAVACHVDRWATRSPHLAACLSRAAAVLGTYGKNDPPSLPWEEAVEQVRAVRRWLEGGK